jgi:hypothetical protein
MQNVIIPNVVLPGVVMPNVIMESVVAPNRQARFGMSQDDVDE